MRDLGQHMEAVARRLWGDPNPAKSRPKNPRWGSNGARSVCCEKGVWFDNETNEGGGVLDLIARETGLTNGAALDWLRAEGFIAEEPATGRRIAATYRYEDEAGVLLFEVVRYEPKDFRQRAPDGTWSTKGIRRVVYQMPALAAAPDGATVYLTEGEKDADRLAGLGLLATTCPGGANKWRNDYGKSLARFRVIILPDNDSAGRVHARTIAEALRPRCPAVWPCREAGSCSAGGARPARCCILHWKTRRGG